MYIIELPGGSSSKNEMAKFAYDTSMFHSEKPYQLAIQNDINSKSKWIACNMLSISTFNCDTKSFGSGKPLNIITANMNKPDKPHCNIASTYRFN